METSNQNPRNIFRTQKKVNAVKKTKPFLVFFSIKQEESQIVTASENEVRTLCDKLQTIGASYVPLQLCIN